MGSRYDPLEIPDPTKHDVHLPQFTLTADVSADRFSRRRDLLAAIDRTRAAAHASPAIEKMDGQGLRIRIELRLTRGLHG